MKKISLCGMAAPCYLFGRMIEMQLPDLSSPKQTYSLSYIADEMIAYKIFQRRQRSRAMEAADANAEDKAILAACVMCDKKGNLRNCSRCKGRGPEWAHKISCPKIAGKPLRVDLDCVEDETSIDSLGTDLTYGFILVKRVKKNKK